MMDNRSCYEKKNKDFYSNKDNMIKKTFTDRSYINLDNRLVIKKKLITQNHLTTYQNKCCTHNVIVNS